MVLEPRVKEPFLDISMALENGANFRKGSFHLIIRVRRGQQCFHGIMILHQKFDGIRANPLEVGSCEPRINARRADNAKEQIRVD